MQLVALVEDQVSVELDPLWIEFGLAEIETVGASVAAVTVTFAEPLALPPAPLQLRV